MKGNKENFWHPDKCSSLDEAMGKTFLSPFKLISLFFVLVFGYCKFSFWTKWGINDMPNEEEHALLFVQGFN